MATRYDDYIEFHNPTNEDFIGTWEREDYLIPAGSTERYPAWLARHFAKRLCDREMILQYGEALREESPKRVEFIEQCLLGVIVSFEDRTIKTTKQQIDEERRNFSVSKKEKIARLRQQLAQLEGVDLSEDGDLEEETPEEEELPPRNKSGRITSLSPAERRAEIGDVEVDEDDEDEAPVDEDYDPDTETKEQRENRLKKEAIAENKATAQAIKNKKARPMKNPVGSRLRTEGGKQDQPTFEGDVADADANVMGAFEDQLQQDLQSGNV